MASRYRSWLPIWLPQNRRTPTNTQPADLQYGINDGSQNRGPGRPRSSENVTDLINRIAKENAGWGYTRIIGALKNLGITVGRTTVKHILKLHGVEPAPKRGKGMSWATHNFDFDPKSVLF